MSITVRSSRSDLADKCGQSVVRGPGIVHVGSDNNDARLGRAVHDYVARWIDGGAEYVELPTILDAHQVRTEDHEDAMWLSRRALQVWSELRPHYPSPLVEQRLTWTNGWANLEGTLDLVNLGDAEVDVTDWKTGRGGDYRTQLRMNGILALEQVPTAVRAIMRTVWLRSGDPPQVEVFTRQRADAWRGAYVGRLANSMKEETYSPGPHCIRCTRRLSCPSYTEWTHPSIGLLDTPLSVENLTPAACEKIEKELTLLDAMDVYRDEYRDRLKAFLFEHNVTIPLSNGRELAVSTPKKRRINPRKAWNDIFSAVGKSNAIMSSVVTITLRRLEEAVKGVAPRGEKETAWFSLLAAMKKSGALEQVEGSPTMRPRLRKELISDGDNGPGDNDTAIGRRGGDVEADHSHGGGMAAS